VFGLQGPCELSSLCRPPHSPGSTDIDKWPVRGLRRRAQRVGHKNTGGFRAGLRLVSDLEDAASTGRLSRYGLLGARSWSNLMQLSARHSACWMHRLASVVKAGL